MARTIIIASGAWLGAELEAEFGRIPPAFLPIGNRRLFAHQHAELASHADRIILSLPDNFVPEEVDRELLQSLGIETVSVPTGLTLGQSLVYVINITATSGGPIAILHGDTLLRDLDFAAEDTVSVGQTPIGYAWGRVRENSGRLIGASAEIGAAEEAEDGLVFSGWFALSDASLLVQSITRRGGDFLGGLEAYAERKPLRTLRADWLDFGHVATYYQSRRSMTTERSFNQLNPTRRTVVKSSTDVLKIEAEARWFESLPEAMRFYTPAFLGLNTQKENISYSIEYLLLPTLTDLFVFGRLPRQAWNRIFVACNEFLSACASRPAPTGSVENVRALYAEKTQERLGQFAATRNIDLKAPCRYNGISLPSLERMAEIAASAVSAPAFRHLTLTHGDFCFSNIFYDTRANLVRVIDPRGIDSSRVLTSYGDIRYDIAKLYHSVIGRYDLIVAGYFKTSRQGPLDVGLDLPASPLLQSIENEFLSHRYAGMTLDEAAAPAICVLLFLSMLPLHADNPNRQDAFLANAMRLFLKLDAGMRE